MADTRKDPLLEKSEAADGTAPDALESFLSREQNAAPAKEKKPKKSNKTILILIAAVAVVAALVVLLIVLRSAPATMSEDESSEPAAITDSVSSDGEHEITVGVDESGAILHNGTGTLLGYVPADVKQIDVENEGGSFTVLSETPEGEATVYTLVGFEDYPLQDGIADEVANASAAIDFIEIVSAGGNLADFGLDQPRATVKVQFSDDTYATLRVGSDAAAGAGTYLAFGSSDAVYLVATEDVEKFFYSVTEFISLDITESLSDADTSDFTTLTISGSHFPEPITLVPNTDEALNASYLMTAPLSTPANAVESYDIAGNIRGLYAESVVCVNPSDNQLESFGLSDPYAAIEAEYPDGVTVLYSSAPADDGIVHIYNPDKDIVYTIQLAAVCWARTSVEALMPEEIVDVKLAAVSGLTFTSSADSYTFELSSTTETVTDENDVEQTVTTTEATYNGKKLTEDNVNIFFQNLNGIKNQGAADNAAANDKVLSFTLSYSTGRSDDAIVIYAASDSAKYIAEVNGVTVGAVAKSYVDKLIESAASLAKGAAVTSL